jgi:hypothetical protein
MLIIIAIVGLWISWWRNLNRFHNTELLLAKSIQQLEEASTQLKQSMEHIQALEKKKYAGEGKLPENLSGKFHPANESASAEITLTQTLCLHRGGMSDEDIANNIGIPINQVRLILKMHAAKVN